MPVKRSSYWRANCATKSYHSQTDNEPELLTGGEMVMINRDIDLMEKEKTEAGDLQKIRKME